MWEGRKFACFQLPKYGSYSLLGFSVTLTPTEASVISSQTFHTVSLSAKRSKRSHARGSEGHLGVTSCNHSISFKMQKSNRTWHLDLLYMFLIFEMCLKSIVLLYDIFSRIVSGALSHHWDTLCISRLGK